ncbi:STAS domain-containing protein [Leeia sp. TBRC 13508]|uniref:STAS domain-containing protein n=1 Tax=Leeia speluncae TaxID=2884804 RepID=A0ABS8D7S1_9NEIS|nr:STAS domain-containing protein [Leeia speluncae]MCB6184093.1 STAS domain-containing protein [Leeia speluncae]
MFSFFKKKGSNTEESVLPDYPQVVRPSGQVEVLSAPAEPETPSTEELETDFIDDTLMDPTSTLDPVDVSILDEAAILYANEQDRDARELIEAQLQSDSATDIELWLMLFELYQLQDEKQLFEQLALQFVMRFERTAPIWRDSGKKVKAAPETQGVMSLPPLIDITHTRVLLQQLQQLLKKFEEVTIDCQAITQLAPEGCKLLHQALTTVRKSNKKLSFRSAAVFDSALNGKLEVGRPSPDDLVFWLLKLELLQWLDDQENFENTAVDFAVTYEVSPPSWEPPKQVVKPVTPAHLQTTAFTADEDQFALDGVYTALKTAELDKLVEFAKERSTISISCLKLERIDFVAAGHLLHMIVQMQQQGKEIHLRHVSHLVGALFRVLDMHAFCRIHYRK